MATDDVEPAGGWPANDEEGYIVEPAEWSEAFARRIAGEVGIALTGPHWDVIRFMRQWREENGVTPDARHVMKLIGGADRDAGRATLFELFPLGYVKQACRNAGMKRPRAWSTG